MTNNKIPVKKQIKATKTKWPPLDFKYVPSK